MEALKIVGFSTLAAVVYGVLHDEVTAHVCVEYFTVAHPPIFPTESPFLLALGWGALATWWVGFPLGVILAIAARFGSVRKLAFHDVRQMILMLMAVSGCLAFLAGSVGATLVHFGVMEPLDGWGAELPADLWAPFSFDAWAHLTSYAMGILGGLAVVCATVWRRLRQLSLAD